MKCPKCGKQGFRKKDIWKEEMSVHRLKCNKCGEWSLRIEWGGYEM